MAGSPAKRPPRPRRTRWRFAWYALPVLLLVAIAGIWLFQRASTRRKEAEAAIAAKPEAPADLAKLRDVFTQGVDALQRGDGPTAVKRFSSFTFGSRQVEEYRLYFLAQGHQLSGQKSQARRALARLWSRNPRMVFASDVAFNLGALYSDLADWQHAGETYRGLGARAESPNVDASAQWSALESSFNAGDTAAMLNAARRIVIDDPRSPQAVSAGAILRSLAGSASADPLRLSAAERLVRAENLLRDGDSATSTNELEALGTSDLAADLRPQLAVDRGRARMQVRRYEDAVKVFEPLTGGPFKFAIPALYHSSRAYRALSASINPMVNKVIVERKQVGITKVKAKGKKKATTKPRFAKVKRTVQLVDLAKKARKDNYDRLTVERLKDLLRLPLENPLRVEVLNTLIAMAEAKNQDEYEQELIEELVKVDPLADVGLQHFWDKAWAAYQRGDVATAKPLLQFLSRAYINPNIKRQCDYWYARTLERSGERAAAKAIYTRLASAPYDDIYALNSQARGAARQDVPGNPLKEKRRDWPEIADQEMPTELKLSYELTALADTRDARMEIQRNASPANQKYANALLADLYNSAGQTELAYRYLRRAWPQLATVEQDTVPPYFIRMYYPARFHDEIHKYSAKHGVDPYIITGLIHQESAFNPDARSVVGALGLMQLMPATGKELGSRLHVHFTVSKLDDPTTNIEVGTFHFKHLMNLFGGNAQLAVASYNAGQGNVLKWKRGNPRPLDEFLESIPFPETRNYVKRVTILASTYRRIDQ